MEIWDILDSEGNKTGRTMVKGEEKLPEGFYHLGADVWIKNSENKILIQKRSPQKKLSPNVWAMTGGSVIKGETSIETIERDTERDHWMTAEEALEYGLIDGIMDKRK